TVIDWPATLTASTLSPTPGSAIVQLPDNQWAYDSNVNVSLTRQGDCGMGTRHLGGVPSLSCTYDVAWPGAKPGVETLVAFTFLAHTGSPDVDASHWLIVCDVSNTTGAVCTNPDDDIVGVGMAAAVARLARASTGP